MAATLTSNNTTGEAGLQWRERPPGKYLLKLYSAPGTDIRCCAVITQQAGFYVNRGNAAYRFHLGYFSDHPGHQHGYSDDHVTDP
ncbi:hypothetical protein [Pseudomonas idahonensis]|uniref:hypothetical protein n=1 Tax=Pseudomonas idahonensis TaxID=2942628 RepID=UPI0035C00373